MSSCPTKFQTSYHSLQDAAAVSSVKSPSPSASLTDLESPVDENIAPLLSETILHRPLPNGDSKAVTSAFWYDLTSRYHAPFYCHRVSTANFPKTVCSTTQADLLKSSREISTTSTHSKHNMVRARWLNTPPSPERRSQLVSRYDYYRSTISIYESRLRTTASLECQKQLTAAVFAVAIVEPGLRLHAMVYVLMSKCRPWRTSTWDLWEASEARKALQHLRPCGQQLLDSGDMAISDWTMRVGSLLEGNVCDGLRVVWDRWVPSDGPIPTHPDPAAVPNTRRVRAKEFIEEEQTLHQGRDVPEVQFCLKWEIKTPTCARPTNYTSQLAPAVDEVIFDAEVEQRIL